MAQQSHFCLLLLFLVHAVLGQECPTEKCVKDCTNCAGLKVPDLENCRGYYLCLEAPMKPDDHYPMPFDCPDGNVFDATKHDCVLGADCEPCPFLGTCVYECPTLGEATNIPSFEDCHNYYTCDGTNSQPSGSETCDAATPFFDGEKCQTDETHCCHCHAYCYTEDVGFFISDPLDCRRYYLCTTESENPENSGSCPDGENFDSMLGQCSSTATCKTACFNVLGPDGCIEPYTCLSSGFFARCPNQCTADYYHCTEVTGEYQAVESCTSGTVFHPDTHTCVSPSQCPYTR